MLIYWSVPDCLLTPGTESLTWHIFWMQSLTDISPTLESCPRQTSFYFLFQPSPELPFFFTDASVSDTSAFSPFASMMPKEEIYEQMVGSLSGQVFQSGCHQFSSSWNILDTNTKWPPIRLKYLNGWLASDDWVTSLHCSLGLLQ